MMEDDRLEGGESDEEKSDVKAAIGFLLDPNNSSLLTELDNPLAITTLVIYAKSLRDEPPFVPSSDAILEWVLEFKLNMVPFKRKRVMEAIQAADAASGASREREKSRLREKMLGSFSD